LAACEELEAPAILSRNGEEWAEIQKVRRKGSESFPPPT
jgi:hypothetical protein